MQIDIAKAEYRTLLNLIEISHWVLTAHKIEKDPRMQGHLELEQKLLSYAEAMGCGDLVECYKGEYMPTHAYEETISAMPFVDEFVNDTFWDELGDRLVTRDFFEQVDENAFRKMTVRERFECREPYEQRYFDEIETHGLKHLRLVDIHDKAVS